MFEKLSWDEQIRLAALNQANLALRGEPVPGRIRAAREFEAYIRGESNGES